MYLFRAMTAILLVGMLVAGCAGAETTGSADQQATTANASTDQQAEKTPAETAAEMLPGRWSMENEEGETSEFEFFNDGTFTMTASGGFPTGGSRTLRGTYAVESKYDTALLVMDTQQGQLSPLYLKSEGGRLRYTIVSGYWESGDIIPPTDVKGEWLDLKPLP